MRGYREQIHLQGGHSFQVLRWARSVREVEMVLTPGTARRLHGEGDHWHYHAAMELTCFTTGEGTSFIGDNIAPFAAGDVVLLGENLPHYWHARGNSAGLAVLWHFPPSHCFWSFPENLALTNLFQSATRGLRYTGRTATALREGLEMLARRGGPARLAQLLHLFALMAAAPAGEADVLSSRDFALPQESVHQQAISNAMRHLLANFRHPIRLEEILQLTGMSKPTFSRQFKRHSGKTYSEFVNQIRLQAACRELAETETTILDIAGACGFTQISFFNRLFRRVHRCSPSQYRARAKRKQRFPSPPTE